MKRFAIAAAVAAVVSLGFAGKADAQYIYRYNQVTPNGGLVTTNYNSGFGYNQGYQTYYSPYGGVQNRAFYNDAFGNSYGRANGFSPYYGSYNRGYNYAAPSFYNPYGAGYNYNFYRR